MTSVAIAVSFLGIMMIGMSTIEDVPDKKKSDKGFIIQHTLGATIAMTAPVIVTMASIGTVEKTNNIHIAAHRQNIAVTVDAGDNYTTISTLAPCRIQLSYDEEQKKLFIQGAEKPVSREVLSVICKK